MSDDLKQEKHSGFLETVTAFCGGSVHRDVTPADRQTAEALLSSIAHAADSNDPIHWERVRCAHEHLTPKREIYAMVLHVVIEGATMWTDLAEELKGKPDVEAEYPNVDTEAVRAGLSVFDQRYLNLDHEWLRSRLRSVTRTRRGRGSIGYPRLAADITLEVGALGTERTAEKPREQRLKELTNCFKNAALEVFHRSAFDHADRMDAVRREAIDELAGDETIK